MIKAFATTLSMIAAYNYSQTGSDASVIIFCTFAASALVMHHIDSKEKKS